MLVLSLVVVGVFSYFSLGVDLFPKVDIPTVSVSVATIRAFGTAACCGSRTFPDMVPRNS